MLKPNFKHIILKKQFLKLGKKRRVKNGRKENKRYDARNSGIYN